MMKKLSAAVYFLFAILPIIEYYSAVASMCATGLQDNWLCALGMSPLVILLFLVWLALFATLPIIVGYRTYTDLPISKSLAVWAAIVPLVVVIPLLMLIPLTLFVAIVNVFVRLYATFIKAD